MTRALLLAGLVASLPAWANTQTFQQWVEELRKEAKSKDLSDATLKALDGIEPIPKVLALYQKQPEFTLTFDEYAQRVLSEQRMVEGQRMFLENKETLQTLSAKYKVQPQFLVALWGAETAYGTITGDYSIVAALATLAYGGRRAAFFRKELLASLKILDQGHISAEGMKGSWAGAMGQCQFMPTTFLEYAADGDGDGKRDIWTNRADVWASTANYLSKLRWKGQQSWGAEVTVPEDFPADALGLKASRPVEEWNKLGVKTLEGKALAKDTPPGAVLKPGNTTARTFIIHDNYRALLKWNRSQYFATAVGILSDAVVRAPPRVLEGDGGVGSSAPHPRPASDSGAPIKSTTDAGR
ncbi:MAG: lytic murein transglycosylase [Myxococcaceae bacterium]